MLYSQAPPLPFEDEQPQPVFQPQPIFQPQPVYQPPPPVPKPPAAVADWKPPAAPVPPQIKKVSSIEEDPMSFLLE